jgi:hypothetical protein
VGAVLAAVDGTSAGQPRRRGMAVGIPELRSVQVEQFLGTREALPLLGNDTDRRDIFCRVRKKKRKRR